MCYDGPGAHRTTYSYSVQRTAYSIVYVSYTWTPLKTAAQGPGEASTSELYSLYSHRVRGRQSQRQTETHTG